MQVTRTQKQKPYITILKSHDGYFIAQYHQMSITRLHWIFPGFWVMFKFLRGEKRDVIQLEIEIMQVSKL